MGPVQYMVSFNTQSVEELVKYSKHDSLSKPIFHRRFFFFWENFNISSNSICSSEAAKLVQQVSKC